MTLRPLMMLWVLGFALACATSPPATEPTPRVQSVRIEGVEGLPERAVRRQLITRAPRFWQVFRPAPELDRLALEEDRERIRALYRRHGYFEAEASYRVEPGEDRESVAVRIRVREGPPVELAEFHLDLGGVDPSLVDREALGLELGERFGTRDYQTARDRLLTTLRNAGYPRAALEGGAEVDLSTHEARVEWSVIPGPRVRLGEVRYVGLERVHPATLDRELTALPGTLYSEAALRDAQRRLFQLGLFRSVEAEAAPSPDAPPDVWTIQVRVVEREPRSVRAGMGYGTEERLRVEAGFEHRNFLGEARELLLRARYSSLLASFTSRVKQRHFLWTGVDFDAGASLSREQEPAFDADRARSHVGLERRLGESWSGRLGYSLEWNDVTEVSESTERILDRARQSFLLSTLESTLRFDSSDDRLNPTRGTRLRFQLGLSPTVLASDFDFLKTEAEASAFYPIGMFVLAGRLELGTILPFGNTSADEIPLVTRFFSGGSTSVRGFGYQELGPLDDAGEPVGGTGLVEGSLELRFPIWGRFGGVVFVDAGQVTLDPFRFRAGDVGWSTGVGLRARTPVGPLRIDVGFPFDTDDAIPRTPRLHLSIGHAF